MAHLGEMESKAFFDYCEAMAGHLRAAFGGQHLMTHVRLLDGAPVIQLLATETSKGIAKFEEPLNLILKWPINIIKAFLENPELNMLAFIDDLDNKLALWERAMVFDRAGLSQTHSGARHIELDRFGALPSVSKTPSQPPSGT
ncbi:hypothetical protein [Burkholderia pseudomallei]|uniref:hypothetical protein n=1 Tax=Burkholderia pseudomallei TaxID=28450 RepID=UPI000F0925CD|nr:hypothetical protein [Burkholderia pseudomallei]MBF3487574.1 hypothetical protein [Burkholderia pseudomallei]